MKYQILWVMYSQEYKGSNHTSVVIKFIKEIQLFIIILLYRCTMVIQHFYRKKESVPNHRHSNQGKQIRSNKLSEKLPHDFPRIPTPYLGLHCF